MNVAQVVANIMARKEFFTDIMMQSGGPVMLKSSRGWVPASLTEHPSFDDIREFALQLDSDWENNIIKGEINRPFDVDGQRLRVNVYLANSGSRLMLSMRKIPVAVPKLAEVGLPASIRVLLDNPSGLMLISGPTGSGKTTTMAAMVECINESRNAHIVSIEEPIEYQFEQKRSIFSQREVGSDCQSFKDGVRAALRQRPDVIVIGEIRDRETAEQAFLAGESGHLVIGTLHASTAVGTVGKMLSFFTDQEREARTLALSGCLLGIVNQTLIPRKDGAGYALAVDFMANHKRAFSASLGEPTKLQAILDRAEDRVSISLGASAQMLLSSEVVAKPDVMKSLIGNPPAYEMLLKP